MEKPFWQGKEIAGIDYFFGFMDRHPDLQLRKPKWTHAARAVGFNKTALSTFSDLLGGIIEQ
jgi:hypothetical protein